MGWVAYWHLWWWINGKQDRLASGKWFVCEAKCACITFLSPLFILLNLYFSKEAYLGSQDECHWLDFCFYLSEIFGKRIFCGSMLWCWWQIVPFVTFCLVCWKEMDMLLSLLEFSSINLFISPPILRNGKFKVSYFSNLQIIIRWKAYPCLRIVVKGAKFHKCLIPQCLS